MPRLDDDEATRILTSFIEDECEAMDRLEEGSFYGRHHDTIKALIGRAPRLLDEEGLFEFYFHLLRQGHFPLVKREEDVADLVVAYSIIAPMFFMDADVTRLSRIAGFLVFGHDSRMQLADEAMATLDSYLKHRKVWAHVNNYVSMPTMIAKKDRFVPYAQDEALCLRIIKLLRGLDYMKDDGVDIALWYWGLLFILVLNERIGAAAVEDMLSRFDRSEDWIERLRILRRYLLAAGRTALLHKVDAALHTVDWTNSPTLWDPDTVPDAPAGGEALLFKKKNLLH